MRYMLLSLLILLSITSCNQRKDVLFNGENLDGWTIYLEDQTIEPVDFFYVNDGMIETVGVPLGYLRTNKKYSNYHLHVEWRYPEEPTNSGVFVHVSGEDVIWPAHFQGQLKHKNAGDFIVHGVGESATLRDTTYTSSQENKPVIPKLHSSNENPAGEWNSYDIICDGSTIELQVNGLLQNVALDCSLSEGYIGFQAEGSKIQFRNIWVKPL